MFSNDSAAYSAVYAATENGSSSGTKTGNHSKTHQRVKSFSHFLPGSWFNNTKEVQVEVVVEQNKDDYYDIHSDKKTESPEEGMPFYDLFYFINLKTLMTLANLMTLMGLTTLMTLITAFDRCLYDFVDLIEFD